MSGDTFEAYDALLAAVTTSDPWRHEPGATASYEPDYDLLSRLLSIPVSQGALVVSGRFAAGIDAWLAHELRCAGFSPDEVWPRPERPRILPRDVAVLLGKLPKPLADQVRARVRQMPAVGPSSARILGRAYDKQVDVLISRWDRGPEVMVSTKAQLSAFGKNLPNRFEEAYGDAGNLRARYPLAAAGFFFVQRATVLTQEPDAYERTVDMIRKLRENGPGNGYTATGLLLVDWNDADGVDASVSLRLDAVPDDVAPPQFFTSIVDTVLAVTPVQHHVRVRARRERRPIVVTEADALVEAVTAPGVLAVPDHATDL